MKQLRRSSILLCLLAVAAIVTASSVGGVPRTQAATGGCILRLPLGWSVSSNYAASWTKRLRLSIHTNGAAIRDLSVTLSTFGGDILGKAQLSRTLTSEGHVSIKLRFPMQPGPYSLYFQGYPNADPSCGPKHHASVIRLTGCTTPLPVKIVNAPEGDAASYQGSYSFDVSDPRGVLLRNLSASLSSFAGQVVGKAKIPVLFGKLHVSVPLSFGLDPSPVRYTVAVSGFQPGRPRSCGAARATRMVAFR